MEGMAFRAPSGGGRPLVLDAVRRRKEGQIVGPAPWSCCCRRWGDARVWTSSTSCGSSARR